MADRSKDATWYNPQYLLRASVDSKVYLVMTQDDQRGVHEGFQMCYMALFVLRAGGNRVRSWKKTDKLGSSGAFLNTRAATAELDLRANTSCTVVACTYDRGEENRFQLTLYTKDPDIRFEMIPHLARSVENPPGTCCN